MNFLKDRLKGMEPYHATKIANGIILNANEAPYKIPQKILNEFKSMQDTFDFNRYPDMDNTILNKAIAKSYNLDIENVTSGVGSDEMIDAIFKASITKDDKVISFAPSFSMYKEFSKIHESNIILVPLNDDFSFNVERMIETIKLEHPKLVLLCNPNNPTGTVMSKDEIKSILNSSSKTLFVLDEAYVEFYNEGNIDLIAEYNNLIILRTFSKCYGLASMRCGYAISRKENIEMIDCVKSPYNLNVMTQHLASLVIKNKDLYEPLINNIKMERKKVYDALKSLNIQVYKSEANFLWARLPKNIVDVLEVNKIYIRKMKYNDVDYCRITIGSEYENDMLIEVIKNENK